MIELVFYIKNTKANNYNGLYFLKACAIKAKKWFLSLKKIKSIFPNTALCLMK
ncbi:hypothetical protein FEM08_00870 [Flavobacterium gilvum]|nr:hypothetical protein FEM08_00870 [Flavobacterium gilvum]